MDDSLQGCYRERDSCMARDLGGEVRSTGGLTSNEIADKIGSSRNNKSSILSSIMFRGDP